MIDQLMGARATGRDTLVDHSYNPSQAILGYLDSGSKDSDKLAVIFPSWHSHKGDPAFASLARHLNSAGYLVRSYDFSDHILEPSIERVLESFRNIQSTVVSQLEALTDLGQYTDVHLIAASLGTVTLGLVASQFKQLSGATIVAGSSNLAASTWYGSRTREVRRALEAQGVTEQQLDMAWRDLAPKTHASAFRNKTVHQIISKTDKIIPTAHQLEMAVALKEAGSQIRVSKTIMGHYATIGTYCYLSRKLP